MAHWRYTNTGVFSQFSQPKYQQCERLRPKCSQTDERAICAAPATAIDILRKKAAQLNELFHTDEWTPRKIDMILWTLRDGQQCS